jgi:DNA-binding NarL/FixJ family response regulator
MAEADIRIVVVAGDPLARAGLAALLAGQPGCEVVGHLPADDQLAAHLPVYRPEALVWDLGWEPAEALETMEEVELPVVALLGDEGAAAAAWAAGARALLLREARPEQVTAALKAVVNGLAVLEPTLSGAFLLPLQAAERPPAVELTPRERQVLQLMAEGLSNKAIALRLEISDHTVKFHINAIMSKLNAQSRTEAVVQATRLGLLLL